MEENRNFILAIVLTIIILFGWEYFYGAPERAANEQVVAEQIAVNGENEIAGIPDMTSGANSAGTIPGMAAPVVKEIAASRADVINTRSNVLINSDRLLGSINLKGLRFDDIALKDYRETVEKDSDIVKLLNPSESFGAYFADFGWIGEGKDLTLIQYGQPTNHL